MGSMIFHWCWIGVGSQTNSSGHRRKGLMQSSFECWELRCLYPFFLIQQKRGCCRSLNLKFLVIHSIKHQVAQTRSWVLCSMFRSLRCLRCSESHQRHVSLLVGILMYLLNSLTTLTLSEKVERMRVKITKYSVH